MDFPGASAHYSPLVGATHSEAGQLWSQGTVASPGIEEMAETGRTTLLRVEAETLRMAGGVGEVLLGGALTASPGAIEMDVAVSETHSRVTLVTMLAPSPDWFVGVDGVDLLDDEGWALDRTMPLHVWDAGTDSGTSYGSPNLDTQPREPVALSTAAPFVDGGTQVGTMRFERLAVVSDEGAAANAVFALGDVSPNPSAGATRISLDAPATGTARVEVFDALGRRVASADVAVAAGRSRLDVPTHGLAPGTYGVRVRLGEAFATKRFAIGR